MAIVGSAYVEIHTVTKSVANEIRDGLSKAINGQGEKTGRTYGEEFGQSSSSSITEATQKVTQQVSKTWEQAGTESGKRFGDRFSGLLSKLGGVKVAPPTINTKKIEADIARVTTRLENLQKQKANPTVDLQIKAAEAKLQALESRLDDLRNKPASAQVEADIREAEAAIASITARLARLNNEKANPKVDMDIADAEARLAVLKANMAGMKDKTVKVGVDSKTISDSIVNVATLGRSLGQIALPAAIIAATPAISSLGASAVAASGALYLLPAAMGAAGVAVGGLVAGFAHLGDALGPTGTPAQIKKVNEAMASLAPQARALVTELRAQGSAWSELRLDVQGRMFQDVAAQVSPLATVILPSLQTALGQTADGFNRSAMGLSAYVQSAAGMETVRTALVNSGSASNSLMLALQPLGQLFIEIWAVGSTYVADFAKVLLSLTTQFGEYVTAARASGELNAIIDASIKVLVQLMDIVVNVSEILGSLFSAAGASGGNFLSTLVTLTGEVNRFLNSAQGQDALVVLFKTINDTVAALMPGLLAVGGALAESIIVLGPVIPQVAEAFSALLIAVTPLLPMLASLASVVLPPLVSLITTLAPALGPLAAAFTAMLVINKVSTAFTTVTTAVRMFAIAQGTLSGAAAMSAGPLAVLSGGIKAVGVAIAANPIGIIITVIAAVVAALVFAYFHFEGFRNVVDSVFSFIKDVAVGFGSLVAGVFNSIVEAIGSVIGWFTRLPETIGGVISTVVDVFNSIVGWFTALPGMIVSALASLGSSIASAATAAWNWLVTTAADAGTSLLAWLAALPNNIAYALGSLAGTLVRLAIDGWNGFSDGIVTAFDATVAWFQALPGRIGSYLVNLGTSLRDNAVAAWDSFTTGLETAFDNTVAWFQALPGNITSYLLGLAVTFTANALAAWNGFTAGLESAFDATVSWFQALPGNITSYLLGLAATFTANAIAAWDGFTAGLETAWDATIAWFQALPDNIATFFSNAGTWLLDVGGNIIDGLIGGLTSAGSAVLDWFLGLADSFMQGFKDALGIASPSTMFAQFGTWILEGLIGGLQALLGGVVSVITGIGSAIVSAFQAAIGFLTAVWDAFWNGFSTVVQTVLAVVQAVISAYLNFYLSIFTFIWNAISAVVTAVWGAIQAFIQAGLAAISAVWSAIWNGIQAVFSAIWNGIQAVAVSVWNAIASFFTAAFNAYVSAFTAIWNGIQAVFSAIWNGIKTVATTVWNAISAFFQAAFAAYQAAFQLIWTTIQNVFQTVWQFIQNTATTIWNAIQAFFTGAFNAFQAAFNAIWNAISAFFSGIWEGIKAAATAIWNAISAYFSAAFDAYTTLFTNIWNNIKAAFSAVWEGIKSVAITLWNAIAAFFTGAWDTFKRLWDSFWDGIATSFDNLWEGIKNVAKSAWEGIQTMFREGINLVIGVVNWPIEKINGALGISIPTIPKLATGGTTDKEGVGSGRVKGVGSTTNDAVLTRLSREEHVWSAAEVRAAGGHDAVRRMRAQVMSGYSPDATTGSLAGAMATRKVSPDSLGGTSIAAGLRRRQLMDKFPKLDDAGRGMLAYGGVRPHVAAAGDEVTRALGAMPGGIGGVGARGNVSDHPSGLALDFMSMGNVGLGDRVAQYLQGNAQRLAVKYLIWQQAINEGSGWEGMEDRGSATANHMDHVHASFLADAGAGQAFGGGGLFDPGKLFDDAAAMLGLPGASRQMTRDIMPNSPDWLEPMGVSFHDKAWDGMRGAAIKLLEALSTLGGLIGGGPGATGPVQDQVRAVANGFGWGSGPEWDAIYSIVQKESSWNPAATNGNAKGLFQKMTSLHGPVEPTAGGQAQWGLNYIKGKYGTPTAALAHHNQVGSYDTGGWLKPGITQAINGTGKPEAIIADPMTTFERSFKNVFKWFAPEVRDGIEDSWRGASSWIKDLIGHFAPRDKPSTETPDVPPVVIPPIVVPPLPAVEVPPVYVPEMPTGALGISFSDALAQFAPELSLAINAKSGPQIREFGMSVMANSERMSAISASMGVSTEDLRIALNDLVGSVTPIVEAGPIGTTPPQVSEPVLDKLVETVRIDRGYNDSYRVSPEKVLEGMAKAAGMTVAEFRKANPNITTVNDTMKEAQVTVSAGSGAKASPSLQVSEGAVQLNINGNADAATIEQINEVLQTTLTEWSDEIMRQYEGRT